MKERTIADILKGFRKVELEDLGNILGRELSSRLRKAEQVAKLNEYLTTRPKRWLSHLLERDIRLLKTLVHGGPGKVHYLEKADYPSILEVSGLVETEESEGRFNKVWVRREVYDIVAPHIDQAIRKGEKSGRFQMERVGIGYLNLYGVLPTDHFLDLMANYYEDTFGPDYDALVRILRESPLLRVCRNVDERGDYLFSPCVGNPEEVFLLREELALNPAEFKAFPVEMALEAGAGAPYFTVGMKTPEGETLTRLLRQIGYEGFDLVKAQHDIWAEAQFPFGNKALFAPVIDRRDSIASDAVHYASLKAIVDYANSVPKWTLNGYNALEMDVLVLESPPPEDPAENLPDDADYPRWTMPRPTISEGYSDLIEKDEVLDRLSPLMPEGFPFGLAIPHVAPMDPCPCGSGLRYCHCHGKNLN